MEAAMDTDEAGEVSLEPEGTAVDTQKKCNTLFIRWGYTLLCDRAFTECRETTF